jgi:hypothetical protein
MEIKGVNQMLDCILSSIARATTAGKMFFLICDQEKVNISTFSPLVFSSYTCHSTCFSKVSLRDLTPMQEQRMLCSATGSGRGLR